MTEEIKTAIENAKGDNDASVLLEVLAKIKAIIDGTIS
jgi:hypothetical protein